MQAPESFVRSLQAQFNGKFRVRWSAKRQRWQIEQRADCPALPPVTGDAAFAFDDDAIRFHDGYHYFAEVAPGTLTPCGTLVNDGVFTKRCMQDLKITASQQFGMLTCPSCGAYHTVAHWELNDALLEHIRSTDPERNAPQRKLDSAYHARNLKEKQRASLRREMAAIAADEARVDIPKVGYTGKENAWVDAPEPGVRFRKVYK